MKTLLARVTSNRPLFIKLLVASFLVNILALATPIYVIQVLQRYVAYGVTSTLVTLILGVTFIVIFEFFFRNIRHRMAREYELKNVEIANMVLTKLNNIKSHIYEVSFKLRNDLINKNLNIIQNTFSASIILIILDVPFTIIFLLALFLIHYQIGLICLFFLLIPFLIDRVYSAKINKLSKQSELIQSSVFRIFDNVITRNLSIKFYALTNPIAKSWNFLANRTANNREDLEAEKNLVSSFSSSIGSLLTISVIGWGATLAVDGQISVGALIGANILAARALMPLIRYVGTKNNLLLADNSMNEINEYLKIPSDNSEGASIKDFNGHIEIRDLFFQYPNTKNPIFESLNLSFGPGNIVSIIGSNGSGKSTLINIFSSVLEITRGNILIDGVELSQLSKTWYRNQIAFSPQEPKFIDGSLKDNLIGSNEVKESDFVRILSEVDLANYINNRENGINTLLEDRGETLPVGIRKRMSLARAMVKQSQLFVLDEPTEGLDKAGREKVITLIKNECLKNKSIIIATNDQEIVNMSDVLIDMSSKPKPNISMVKK
jgi:ATP-binding cassette subfamily C protein LapB